MALLSMANLMGKNNTLIYTGDDDNEDDDEDIKFQIRE